MDGNRSVGSGLVCYSFRSPSLPIYLLFFCWNCSIVKCVRVWFSNSMICTYITWIIIIIVIVDTLLLCICCIYYNVSFGVQIQRNVVNMVKVLVWGKIRYTQIYQYFIFFSLSFRDWYLMSNDFRWVSLVLLLLFHSNLKCIFEHIWQSSMMTIIVVWDHIKVKANFFFIHSLKMWTNIYG